MSIYVEFVVGWARATLGRSERGASLVEYAFLVGLIALVCVAALTFLGTSVSTRYSEVNSGFNMP